MAVRPYTVRPETVAGGSILLHPGVTPYTVRPRRVGGPGWDAQRFYFRASTVAEVSPAFDGAWTNTSGALRRELGAFPSATDTVVQGSTISWTSGQLALDRQFVGPMMRGGVTLTGATFTGIIRHRELADSDNVTTLVGIRIVSADGATVRATLLPVDHYGTGLEFTTTFEGRILANAEALAAYTTIPGDRLVVEVGYADASGTTPQGNAIFGSSAVADMALTETIQGLNAWCEFTPAA